MIGLKAMQWGEIMFLAPLSVFLSIRPSVRWSIRFCVRSILFELLVVFTNNTAQMSSMMS